MALHRKRAKRTKDDEEVREESVRPFWSGTISFGLVSIPVNLFPGSRDSHVSLRMLGPDGEPLKREYYAPETGKDVSASDTTRAFEVSKGKYITVSDEELERLAPEKSRDIDLRLFVPRGEISPLYFEKAYFLTPADKSAKAYRLLAETMEGSGRTGIATFVMRGTEYLIAIFAEDGILRAETLRFSGEIRKPPALGLPKKRKPQPAAVRRFQDAIKKASKKTLDAKEMRDQYSEAMLKLIEKKRARHTDVVEGESPSDKPARVVDLMEVLKQSLGQGRGRGK